MKGKKVTGISAKKSYYRVFLVLSLVLSLMMANSVSAASTLTVTSSGAKSIDVSPATGTAIVSDSINVTTNCRYGYNFAIQTSVDDNNLYLDGDSNNVDAVFSPASGYALNETTNEWGYFYDYDYEIVPDNDFGFWAVPVLSDEPALLKFPLEEPSLFDINDSFNVYYGVSVGYDATPGTYKMIPDESDNDGTIVYIATVAEECSRYTVHFNPTGIFEGNTLSGTGTMDDQVIEEGMPTVLDDMDFTAPNGYYFAAWNTAQDGSGAIYTNMQEVTDIATAGSDITLYAMWTDCPPSTICYSPNVSNPSDVEGEMGDQQIPGYARIVALYVPNYRRANYGFAGWNTNPGGTGANYGPNSTLEFSENAYGTGGLKLYAKWITSAGNMQNWTCPNDVNMPIGTVTALKDIRDNDVYAVAKLADGKCWMIENLRLADKDSNNNDVILSSANTHNPSLPLTNSWWYSSANDNDPIPTSNHLSATTTPASWCYNSYTYNCNDQSMLATNNTTLFINNTATNYSAYGDVYGYGNYYNWYSATAGNGSIGMNIGDVAVGDICPVGWHLPTGESGTGEFALLDIALGGSGYASDDFTSPDGDVMSRAYRSYPNNFVLSGNVYSKDLVSRYVYGRYWSKTSFGVSGAYILSLSDDLVNPGETNTVINMAFERLWDGVSVRCIAGT